MSRWDLTGLFWDDYVEPKAPTIKEKRQPPEPVWLAPDYLPHYEEARDFEFDEAAPTEIVAWASEKRQLTWDTEFYPNYALIGFLEPISGKVVSFEKHRWMPWSAPLEKLRWIAENFTLIGFNDREFDAPMLHAALDGRDTDELMRCVDHIIFGDTGFGTRSFQFYKDMKLKPFKLDQIDLMELTPLSPSLKVCSGRMHARRMADLPFQPGRELSAEQIRVLRWYWVNDLRNTYELSTKHKAAIELREILTREYGVDVRSNSDPQIAESVIRAEIQRRTGRRWIQRAQIVPFRSFTYAPPAYLKYQSPTMQWVLNFVCQQRFVVDPDGSPMMPADLSNLTVPIGDSVYKLGIGGLHSQEKRRTHVAGDDYEITDNDVTSYYPSLIIQQGMYPPHVGPEFLAVFKDIVTRRIAAKRAGDKGTAETLKIVANGTFGKTGEKHGRSVVYYPEMMIQVTVTGQLSLLLLIERLELAGISVISANTDGIMVKCHKSMLGTRDAIMRQWEADTGLELESKGYSAVYSRDVNNYVALYVKPDDKEKSAYRWVKAVGAYRKTLDVYPLKWNPSCEIVNEALVEYLATGRSIDEIIRGCTDVRKFIAVRLVRGGACKNGEYLGKAIRWYYSTEVEGEIINVKNGHSVSLSAGARPCMTLPDAIPPDLNYDYYVERAIGLLADFAPKKSAAEKKALASAVE